MIDNPRGAPLPRVASVPVPSVKPFFTYVILAVTVLVYLAQWTFGDAFTYSYGLKINNLILQGQYWRLITPIFFHASPIHLFFNMYALYNIGNQIERPLGYARFLMIYFFSGMAGVFASFLFNKSPSLGASGAIFGLIGALAVFLFRHRSLLGAVGRSMLTNVIFIIVMNLAISFTPQIDLWGHLGGLAAGLALTAWIGPRWELDADPVTGHPRLVDGNPFSRRLLLAGFVILAFFTAALWMAVR